MPRLGDSFNYGGCGSVTKYGRTDPAAFQLKDIKRRLTRLEGAFERLTKRYRDLSTEHLRIANLPGIQSQLKDFGE